MVISERSARSKERTPRVRDACFKDWKSFCFVLREIGYPQNRDSGDRSFAVSGPRRVRTRVVRRSSALGPNPAKFAAISYRS
jgi:hypothetical protein